MILVGILMHIFPKPIARLGLTAGLRMATLAAGLGSVLILGGCGPAESVPPPVSPLLSGQVFLVLPEGNSLRLASAEVLVFDVEAMNRFRSEAGRTMELHWMEMEHRHEVLQGELERIRDKRAEAEVAMQTRRAAIRDELHALREANETRLDQLRQTIETNRHFIDHVERMPDVPPGIPTRAQFEQYRANRAKWLAMSRDERRIWANALQGVNQRIEAEIREMEAEYDRRLAGWEGELEDLGQVIDHLRGSLGQAVEGISDHRDQMGRFPTLQEIMEWLPEPMGRTRTDADGEFVVRLPRGGEYSLLVRAPRPEPGRAGPLVWFVRADVDQSDGARVLLSNHNLTDGGDASEAFSLPSLQRGFSPQEP